MKHIYLNLLNNVLSLTGQGNCGDIRFYKYPIPNGIVIKKIANNYDVRNTHKNYKIFTRPFRDAIFIENEHEQDNQCPVRDMINNIN